MAPTTTNRNPPSPRRALTSTRPSSSLGSTRPTARTGKSPYGSQSPIGTSSLTSSPAGIAGSRTRRHSSRALSVPTLEWLIRLKSRESTASKPKTETNSPSRSEGSLLRARRVQSTRTTKSTSSLGSSSARSPRSPTSRSTSVIFPLTRITSPCTLPRSSGSTTSPTTPQRSKSSRPASSTSKSMPLSCTT